MHIRPQSAIQSGAFRQIISKMHIVFAVLVCVYMSTALFTFPKDRGGLQMKMPRAIICSAAWGHLTRCCQFDDVTRQLAEITYKDALEKHGCLDLEDICVKST